ASAKIAAESPPSPSPAPNTGIRELCVVVQCRQTITQHPIPNEEFGAKWLERHVTCGLEICRKTSERIEYESILNGTYTAAAEEEKLRHVQQQQHGSMTRRKVPQLHESFLCPREANA
ncbi:hypothetical protein TSAR_008215, partial [Trichomalopsis sarcophagae]